MALAPGGKTLAKVLSGAKRGTPVRAGSRMAAAHNASGKLSAVEIITPNVASSSRMHGTKGGTNYLAMGFEGKAVAPVSRATTAPASRTIAPGTQAARTTTPSARGPARMQTARKPTKPIFDPSVQRFRGPGGRFVPTPAPKPKTPAMRGAPPKAPGSTPMRPPPPAPPPNPNKAGKGFFAQHGKKVAAGVVAGGLIGGYAKNRTGKAVDPNTGLPKGVYGY